MILAFPDRLKRMGGLLGPLVAWCEPGLVLMGFAIRTGDAKGKLGKVPARVRRAAKNDRAGSAA